MKSTIKLGNTLFPLDFRGHLKTYSMWSLQLMEWFAQQEGVKLNQEHIEIITFIRGCFEKRRVHPVVRIVTAHMKEAFCVEKGTIKYFHTLFPKGIHQAYKIAGLPPVVQSV